MTADVKLGLIVDLMSDVDSIQSSLTPLFDTLIWPRAQSVASDAAPLRACLDAACAKIKAKLEPFVEFIIGAVSAANFHCKSECHYITISENES